MRGRAVRTGRATAGAVLALLLGLASPMTAQEEAPSSDPDTQPVLPLQQGTPVTPVQQQGPGQVRSPVLTIDTERLFAESLFGQRVLAELSAATDALAAENRRIEAELTEEEQSLTQRRPTMDVASFREEADAFDARVQRIRIEQDTKERDLQRRLGEGQEAFLTTATPILGQLMLERGAAVILDRRTVLLAVGFVDVTDAAIAAINAEIGDGAGQP